MQIGTTVFNAKPATILGPACLGDAITTGFSNKSRNYLIGLLLAKKASLGNSEHSFLCEGKNNVKLIKNLSEERGLNIPITNFVYEIINGDNAYPTFFTLWHKLKSYDFK
jgi:glycerol-3-phosphate dehydrogenase